MVSIGIDNMTSGSSISAAVERDLLDRYRCPTGIARFTVAEALSEESGYFRFGPDVICYGQCSSGTPSSSPGGQLLDVHPDIRDGNSAVQLPFDPSQVVGNLRRERYHTKSTEGRVAQWIRNGYYLIRPLMPIPVRRHFQELYLRDWQSLPFPQWPVDWSVESLLERLLILSMNFRGIRRVPFIWFWPNGLPCCSIMTHDVETEAGLRFCSELMDLNDSFGIKSSFQIVPEKRYSIPPGFIEGIRERGFEANVHDLNHDGHLFRSHGEFRSRAKRINQYVRDFQARGFRSAVMYRNVEWFDAFDFSYDMSVPNVAHLDPQRGGCCTAFPYFIGKILELPVTTIQDYSLFNILHDYSTAIWKKQISLLRAKNGLISTIIHPDYIIADKPRRVYTELLQYLKELHSSRQAWMALPHEVDTWWRLRSEMRLVEAAGSWRVEGPGSESAKVAYAVLDGDELKYEF